MIAQKSTAIGINGSASGPSATVSVISAISNEPTSKPRTRKPTSISADPASV